MSSFYNLEPQPTASCILHTTAGDISLELWASQLPLTCRNFLQHCLDGYYDNTIFHRLVPNFIIQGGDPTGTGNGGESIYDGGAFSESREEGGIWPMEDRKGKNAGSHGVGFKNEFHSRIKFNRRGLLGMANEGPDTNGSQFFITLDNTPELQGKNTVFGRVQGETIYNVVRMGEAEIVEGDRPLYPVRIISVEILVNFFKDMVKRVRVAPILAPSEISEKKKKRKLTKNLLSFSNEAEDSNEIQTVDRKRKFDSRIVMDIEDEQNCKQGFKSDFIKKSGHVKELREDPTTLNSLNPLSKPKPLESHSSIELEAEERNSSSPEPIKEVTLLLDQTNTQIAELKASLKRKTHLAPKPEKKKTIFESLLPSNSMRGRKRRTGESVPPDPKTLEILKTFQSKLEQKTPLSSPKSSNKPSKSENSNTSMDLKVEVDDEEATVCDLHFIVSCQSCSKWDQVSDNDIGKSDTDMDLNGDSWMYHSLNFKEDKLGKDLTYRKKAEEELVVIDPREKERSLREEMKSRREARSDSIRGGWNTLRNVTLDRRNKVPRNF